MKRQRKAKIAATIGPSSSTPKVIESLYNAGADVFRFNFSHGQHAEHEERYHIVRDLERKYGRPITILADLQGPKLRIGTFIEGKISLKSEAIFTLDLDQTLGNTERVCLPHPEIFAALHPNTELLLDDGRIRLHVLECDHNFAKTRVITGGDLSNRKGVNVPKVHLPIAALTEKDKIDLDFALSLGMDWIALSFVQSASDLISAKNIIQNSAKIMAKIEKPLAVKNFNEILKNCDGVMVARGDLGVEMPLEDVPCIQKKIIHQCRELGKPVIVATQMLESMIHAPSPTRAEASDVATAIYEGVDAVMLSAESASGDYPVEAVEMMNRIIIRIEQDPTFIQMMNEQRPNPLHTTADAITTAARQVAQTIRVPVIVTFTETGSTTFRAARERPEAPILALTPNLDVARQLGIIWGVHAQLTQSIYSTTQMVEAACEMAVLESFAKKTEQIIITAGVPFGKTGNTNILRVAIIE